jgi:hypothetical protein
VKHANSIRNARPTARKSQLWWPFKYSGSSTAHQQSQITVRQTTPDHVGGVLGLSAGSDVGVFIAARLFSKGEPKKRVPLAGDALGPTSANHREQKSTQLAPTRRVGMLPKVVATRSRSSANALYKYAPGTGKPRRTGLSPMRPSGLEPPRTISPQGPQPESPGVDVSGCV